MTDELTVSHSKEHTYSEVVIVKLSQEDLADLVVDHLLKTDHPLAPALKERDVWSVLFTDSHSAFYYPDGLDKRVSVRFWQRRTD